MCGSAYEYLKTTVAYFGNNLGYSDTESDVAIGCGYGGYVVNWIQGHEFGRRFKALITDNGIFSLTTPLEASDTTIQALRHAFNGLPWKKPNQ
jgi:dipeptidyl aminopeptidase/acylaminoacyl peptidase